MDQHQAAEEPPPPPPPPRDLGSEKNLEMKEDLHMHPPHS
jgi:hypothetical protein